MSAPVPDRAEIQPEMAEAESTDPREIASEQFAHGVITSLHLDTVEGRERRIVALLQTLDRNTRPIQLWTRIRWRVLSGVAAAIAMTALVILGIPTQTSATAMVEQSLQASKRAGDRRYEIKARLPRDEEEGGRSIGTLDVRDATHVLIQVLSPFGDRVVVGRNGDATWAIRPDGTVDKYAPQRAWPRWVDFGQSTVLLVPVEELMTSLGDSYTLTRRDPEVSPSGNGPECERIGAEHKPGPSPDPTRVELWIDPRSHVVRRMELHWKPPPRPEPANGPENGPEGNDPRPPRPPGPDGIRGEGPPHRPPPGARPPRHGPPGGPRPRPGPPGFGPDEGPGPHPPHPPPEFLGGPPDFEGGRRPPPPRMLVLELIEGAPFGEGWFKAETHAK